jgi:hypothetical protein
VLPNAHPVHCLLQLNLNAELSFRHLQTVVKEFNFDSVNEELCGTQSVVNAVKTRSTEQS